MMNKYTMMLAITAGLSLGSHIALAQTPNVAAPRPGPEAPLPVTCKELVGKGFTIHHQTISRGGGSAIIPTTPHANSYPAPRQYNQGGNDKFFIDSFPAHAKEGCRICGVTVAIKGVVSPQSQGNDSVTLVGSNKLTVQFVSGQLNSDHIRLPFTPAGGPLGGTFSKVFTIEGAAWMSWYMASLVPNFDVAVQDDTMVNAVAVTYYYY